MDINRHHLAVVHAVAEAGSVTGAAERLGITQPAVSRQLAQLEDAIGMTLFDRGRGGARPTAAGTLVHEHTIRLEAMHARLVAALDDLRARRAGRLRLGASTTVGVHLVPPLLRRFAARFAGIAVEIEIGNTREIEAGVAAGALDVGMVEGVIDDDRLASRVFAEDDLVAIVPPDHAWAKRRTISPEAFRAERYLAREPGSGTRAVTERAFARRGLTLVPHLVLHGTPAIKAYVAAGHGVSIVSGLTVRDEQAAGKLVAVAVRGLRLHRDLHLVQLAGHTLSPAATSLVSLVFGRHSRPPRIRPGGPRASRAR